MALDACPLISILIPTRNRLGELLLTLDRLARDPHPCVETFVYDDASEVDPRPVLEKRFPDVRALRSGRRVGPCELRNRMAAMANGSILVGFDDDSALDDRSALGRVAHAFETCPRLGLLSCRVRNGDGTIWPSERGGPLRETASFIACGFAARRDALLAVGGFDPTVFRQGEERDLVIRLVDAGYEVRQADDVVVLHRESQAERDHQFIHSHALRNELLFVLKCAPGRFVPGRLARQAASHVRFCVVRRWWRALFLGFAAFLGQAPRVLRGRKAVAADTWRWFMDLSSEGKAARP